MDELRNIVAVVVPAESPVGRLVDAINTLAANLPPEDRPTVCPLCPTPSWPCTRFDAAAREVQDGGVAIGPFVPLDLHQRLWPPAAAESH
ncbi:hypothetical protein [Lentzea jiangxiensis]|uniref:hypothetical protein n=1 Tax=Lentzea jiangxiensis TaxID=641025 RepID=UPI00115FCDE7|nr:hypothetical protein [Lentzea jiangxiensis]